MPSDFLPRIYLSRRHPIAVGSLQLSDLRAFRCGHGQRRNERWLRARAMCLAKVLRWLSVSESTLWLPYMRSDRRRFRNSPARLYCFGRVQLPDLEPLSSNLASLLLPAVLWIRGVQMRWWEVRRVRVSRACHLHQRPSKGCGTLSAISRYQFFQGVRPVGFRVRHPVP